MIYYKTSNKYDKLDNGDKRNKKTNKIKGEREDKDDLKVWIMQCDFVMIVNLKIRILNIMDENECQSLPICSLHIRTRAWLSWTKDC